MLVFVIPAVLAGLLGLLPHGAADAAGYVPRLRGALLGSFALGGLGLLFFVWRKARGWKRALVLLWAAAVLRVVYVPVVSVAFVLLGWCEWGARKAGAAALSAPLHYGFTCTIAMLTTTITLLAVASVLQPKKPRSMVLLAFVALLGVVAFWHPEDRIPFPHVFRDSGPPPALQGPSYADVARDKTAPWHARALAGAAWLRDAATPTTGWAGAARASLRAQFRAAPHAPLTARVTMFERALLGARQLLVEDRPARTAQSPIVNPNLETMVDSSKRVEGVEWEVNKAGELRVGRPPDDTAFPIPGADQITFVRSFEVDSSPGMLVGYRDPNGDWHLAAAADTDGDRLPEAATLQVLVSTSSQLFITDVQQHENRLYALDRRCQDLYVLSDTDADGLPDVLEDTPFAKSADHPDLLGAERIFDVSGNYVDVVAVGGTRGNFGLSPYRTHFGEVIRLEDTNSDGVADNVSTWTRTTGVPSLRGRPYDGQTTFKVRAEIGKTAELWTLNSGYEKDALLGTVAGTGDWAELTIADPLAEDDIVGICYSAGTDLAHRVVRAEGPQVLGLQGDFFTSGGTVVIHGLGFDAQTVARLRTGENYNTITPLAASFVSAERLDITYGGLDPSLVGDALIEVERLVDGTARRGVMTTRVCEPSTE